MSTTTPLFFTALLVGLVAYSSYVSFLVARSEAYSSQQRLVQILVVWLLPVFGAALAHWFAVRGTAELPSVERHPYREHELPE